jgi:hypothetical protein
MGLTNDKLPPNLTVEERRAARRTYLRLRKGCEDTGGDPAPPITCRIAVIQSLKMVREARQPSKHDSEAFLGLPTHRDAIDAVRRLRTHIGKKMNGQSARDRHDLDRIEQYLTGTVNKELR